jgi:hypothetical protein
MLLILQKYFFYLQTRILNEELNHTEPSPSVRLSGFAILEKLHNRNMKKKETGSW